MAVIDKTAEVEARLTGVDGAFASVRADAAQRLRDVGFPGRRDEYWRWTNPTALIAVEPKPAVVVAAEPVFAEFDCLKVVFRDGVFDEAASDDLAAEGVEITRLAVAGDDHWAKDAYGVLEAKGQTPVLRPFAILNTATATDGLLIRVTGHVSKPLNLIYVHESDISDVTLHHVVRLEADAEITILESGPAGARFNKVMEVDVAAGARFHHIRAQGPDHDRHAMTHIFAQIAEGALFKTFTLTVNGRLTRNEAVLWLNGDDAVAHIAGAALGDGDFHHDDTVFITHDALRGESRQVFKKVLKNGAQGIFQGKILVKPGAQKTDGYQISQSLLLDEKSQFLGKPELEIYADDVKCSHGSTTGAIDETALFYLRSRGVPVDEAQALLVLSFLADAIDEIEDEALKEAIVTRLEQWLSAHRG